MSEVLEPLAPKVGDTPSIPIGCNRLQSVATDREVWCGNGISVKQCSRPSLAEKHHNFFRRDRSRKVNGYDKTQ